MFLKTQFDYCKSFKNILLILVMQSSFETKIIKLEKFVAELETLNAKLLQEQTQTNLSDIIDHFETLDSDTDTDSDTDSDISFTEEEREHIESEEHYAFLKRYSLKPTVEMSFLPN
jgi:hypothetical protein